MCACTYVNLVDIFSQYIHLCADIAQKVGDFTLGASTESLPVTVYSLPGQNTSQTLVTVTHDLCVIVSEVSVIEDKGGEFII